MKAAELLAMAGFPDTPEGRKAFYKKYPTEDAFHKKMKDGGIAFPQQATEERFFERGYVPNYPVGFYQAGGMTDEIAYPQMPPADMFFSGFPFQPEYAYGGLPKHQTNGQVNPLYMNPNVLSDAGKRQAYEQFTADYPYQNYTTTLNLIPVETRNMNDLDKEYHHNLTAMLLGNKSITPEFLKRYETQLEAHKNEIAGHKAEADELYNSFPSWIKDYQQKHVYTWPQRRLGGDLAFAYGGAPCMNCGGYMQMGGDFNDQYGGQYDGLSDMYATGGDAKASVFGYGQFPAMKSGGVNLKQIARSMKKAYAAGGTAPQGSTMEQNYTSGPNALKSYIAKNVTNNLIDQETQQMMPGRFDYGGEDTVNMQNMGALSNAMQASKLHEYQKEMDSQSFSNAMSNYVNDQYGSSSVPKAQTGLNANQAALQARQNSLFGPMPTAFTQKSNVPMFPGVGVTSPAAPKSLLSPELQAIADKIHSDIKAVDMNPYSTQGTTGYHRNDPFFYKTKYKGWSNDGHSGNKFIGYSDQPFVGRNAPMAGGRMTPEQIAAAQAYWKDKGMDFSYDEKMGLLGQLFKSLGPKKVSMHLRTMAGAPGSSTSGMGMPSGTGIRKPGWNPVSDSTSYPNPDDEINAMRSANRVSPFQKMKNKISKFKDSRSADAMSDQFADEMDAQNVNHWSDRYANNGPTGVTYRNNTMPVTTPETADERAKREAWEKAHGFAYGGYLPMHQTTGQTGVNTSYPGDQNWDMVQKRKLFNVGFNPGQPSAGKDALIAGINMAAGMFEGDPNKRFAETHTSAGDTFNKVSGSRGFNLFDTYAGQVADPSKMGYTNQYGNMSGNIGGYYAADGGQMPDDDGYTYMDDKEIAAFLAAGGELKYVD